jgi:hypothetical protein
LVSSFRGRFGGLSAKSLTNIEYRFRNSNKHIENFYMFFSNPGGWPLIPLFLPLVLEVCRFVFKPTGIAEAWLVS